MFLRAKIFSIILPPWKKPDCSFCKFGSTPSDIIMVTRCPIICNNRPKKRYPDRFENLQYLLFLTSLRAIPQQNNRVVCRLMLLHWLMLLHQRWAAVRLPGREPVVSALVRGCKVIPSATSMILATCSRLGLFIISSKCSVIPPLLSPTTCWPCLLLSQFS